MEIQDRFEAFGFIVKEEQIETIDYHILPNTLVVENMQPFPAYHGIKLPTDENRPGHLYFATKERSTGELIMRAGHRIRKFFAHDFVNDWGELFVNNKAIPVIRIKNLDNYEYISELQKCFIAEGFAFRKKQTINELALTKIHKYFSLEKVESFYFQDLEDSSLQYFTIPKQLTWPLFVKITVHARNTLGYDYDAAMGLIYRKSELMDIVRIYSKDFQFQQLVDCRNQYLELIEKYA